MPRRPSSRILAFTAPLLLAPLVGLACPAASSASPTSSATSLIQATASTTAAPASSPEGWASHGGGTAGGAAATSASTNVVHNRAELLAALDNGGQRTGPKVVQVAGAIFGNERADGRLLGEQDYAPGYDIAQYQACFTNGGAWSDDAHAWCRTMRSLRTKGSNAEKAQIQVDVPSNTTLVGLGSDARLDGVSLSIQASTNIVVRNLTLDAPVDYFTAWSPDDGAQGAWNARFDALSIVTGTHIWIDHCTFTDGAHPDSRAPVGFHGLPVQRHDGLLDMEDGTDLVTVSYSRFLDHDKALLIGSGDSRAERDRGHLRITFHHDLFRNTQQRSPRVRFGQVHLYNNVYEGSTRHSDYPMTSQALGGHHYFLGLGIESKIFSEYNAFGYDATTAPEDLTVANFKGNQFVDHGSWLNGQPVDLNAVAGQKYRTAATAALSATAEGTPPPDWALAGFTTEVGWSPASTYAYRAQTTPDEVRGSVLGSAGAGLQ